ncbi:DUF6731 family protein [Paenibacillus timonensis]|uniref:DUF6731 family protein n=1 Tax=Paenibacillus timonensis TaxID=225915 RepID=UPI003F973B50
MDIKFDFFKILEEEEDESLDTVLSKIEGMDYEKRLRNVYKIPTRIHDIEKKDDIWYGMFMKIRMNDSNLPVIARLTGEVEDLELDTNQGLGEKVGFLYDARHRILVVQRNRHGIGPTGIKYYLERIGKFSFHMEPVLEKNALLRLQHKDNIRRFELKLIRPEGKIREEIKGKSGFKALDLIDEFDSYYVDLKFGFDTSKKNKGRILSKDSIIKMANTIWGQEEEIVEKFSVFGLEHDEEKPDFVDLIKDRISEVAAVEISRNNKMTFEWMSRLLLNAYNARRREIILQYFEE